MADFEIECNECGWRGMESALESHPDGSSGEDGFSFCPDCGGTDFKKITEKE
jgi:hypothetical protein